MSRTVKQKRKVALTVVPVSSVGLQLHARCLSFSLGDDIGEFVCGTLRGLLYAGRVVHPFEYAACRVTIGADMGGGVLAPAEHCVRWEKLPHVPVIDLVPGRRV